MTEEQAKQIFLKYREDFAQTYDIRNPNFKQVDVTIIGTGEYPLAENEAIWGIEIEETAWLCTFEKRRKGPAYHTWLWQKWFCFIVVPKPVPIVMEGEPC